MEQQHNPVLSIVVPLFNEEGNVQPLLESLKETLLGLQVTYEIILVNDGSRDATWPLVQAASMHDSCVKGVSLSRNFGHQNAIFAGMHYARGDAIITMDGDLQHPPKTIPGLYRAWQEGYKVVETRRIETGNVSFFKRVASRWFYMIFSRLSGLQMSQGTSDFRLVDRQVAEAMKDMKDADLFLRGISHWVGFRKTTVSYMLAERHTGETKYSLSKMYQFAWASVLSFSIVPLKLGIWLGLLTSVLAFVELILIIITYFRGNAVPGWASILAVISFMFGILFILIGIIGVYLGSLFGAAKNRPRFLIDETSGSLEDK
jgi:glycosyltransferase involved in cell wall biosynthesis